MWLLFVRASPPDAQPWPGRRWLAAVDAVAWPAAWVALVMAAPIGTGAIGQLVVAVAIVAALRRVHRAVALNHRYHFTTWTWGRRLAAVMLLDWALQLAAKLLSR